MNLSEQTNRIKRMMNIVESHDTDKLYSREYVVNVLSKRGVPKHIKDYIKELPYIDCKDGEGNKHVCTKIPEFIQVYLTGRY